MSFLWLSVHNQQFADNRFNQKYFRWCLYFFHTQRSYVELKILCTANWLIVKIHTLCFWLCHLKYTHPTHRTHCDKAQILKTNDFFMIYSAILSIKTLNFKGLSCDFSKDLSCDFLFIQKKKILSCSTFFYQFHEWRQYFVWK